VDVAALRLEENTASVGFEAENQVSLFDTDLKEFCRGQGDLPANLANCSCHGKIKTKPKKPSTEASGEF